MSTAPTKRRRFYLRHLERKGIVTLAGVQDVNGTVRLHPTPRRDAHFADAIDPDSLIGLNIIAADMRATLKGDDEPAGYDV